MREEVKAIRLKKGISIRVLANEIGISESLAWKFEAGSRGVSAGIAKKWADYLGIPESKIFKYFFEKKPDIMCQKTA
jgi:transcriptional regulator with XRE-family HTH domain